MTVLDIRQRDENTWYYVLDKKGNEGQLHGSKLYDWSQVSEILGEVPSYSEWQASEKYIKHLEEKIKIYKRKDKQATETSIAYNKLAEENEKLKESIIKMKDIVLNTETNNMKSIIEIVNTAKENAILKELLKDCRLAIFDYPPYDLASDKIRLTNKIDEVLK